MIRGHVNARREVIIPVQIHAVLGQTVDIEATVDTGFSGYLTLPPTLIATLQLRYDRTEIYTLGDNSDVVFDIYQATLEWDGHDRDVFVLETESKPLVGMSLLHGHHLFVDVIDGGEVRIQARP
jgi:clan AA aspartic protease